MTDEEIAERDREARRFTVAIDGRRFDGVLPSPVSTLTEIHVAAPDVPLNDIPATAYRTVLAAAALTGWSGVIEGDLFEGAGDTPQPFSRRAARRLLHAKPAWHAAITDKVIELFADRQQKVEAEKKD